MKAPKLRLDQMLVERGLADSRAKAQAAIMAGLVFSGERRLDKPGVSLPADTPLDVRGKPHPVDFLSNSLGRIEQTRLGIDQQRHVLSYQQAGVEDMKAPAETVDDGPFRFLDQGKEFGRRNLRSVAAGADQPLHHLQIVRPFARFAKDRLQRRLQEVGTMNGRDMAAAVSREVGENAAFCHLLSSGADRPAGSLSDCSATPVTVS